MLQELAARDQRRDRTPRHLLFIGARPKQSRPPYADPALEEDLVEGQVVDLQGNRRSWPPSQHRCREWHVLAGTNAGHFCDSVQDGRVAAHSHRAHCPRYVHRVDFETAAPVASPRSRSEGQAFKRPAVRGGVKGEHGHDRDGRRSTSSALDDGPPRARDLELAFAVGAGGGRTGHGSDHGQGKYCATEPNPRPPCAEARPTEWSRNQTTQQHGFPPTLGLPTKRWTNHRAGPASRLMSLCVRLFAASHRAT